MNAASVISSPMIEPRDAPMERLIPISRVRSATLMAIVLITDRPPTTRLIRATPRMMALNIATVDPNAWSKSSAVVACTCPTPLLDRPRQSADIGIPASGYTSYPRHELAHVSWPVPARIGACCREQGLSGFQGDQRGGVRGGQRRLRYADDLETRLRVSGGYPRASCRTSGRCPRPVGRRFGLRPPVTMDRPWAILRSNCSCPWSAPGRGLPRRSPESRNRSPGRRDRESSIT